MALRLRRLREIRGLTQQEMADGLQVPLETYKKQEQRGALRADLLTAFSLIVTLDINTLMKANLAEELALAKAAPKPRKRRRKKKTTSRAA